MIYPTLCRCSSPPISGRYSSSLRPSISSSTGVFGDGFAPSASTSTTSSGSKPEVAQSFILGRRFVNGQPCALMLGDNFLYGHGLSEMLERRTRLTQGARVFAYYVQDPERYGVVEFDQDFNAH